jgi:hypothetical protein
MVGLLPRKVDIYAYLIKLMIYEELGVSFQI